MPVYHTSLTAIDFAEARRYAGLAKAPDFGQDLLETACAEALTLAKPHSIWQEYDYDDAAQNILADSPVLLQGDKIGQHLLGCETVAVLCATVGEEIEQAITDYFSAGKYTLSLLLDAAATAAVEQVADGLEKAIAFSANKRGYVIRPRFSPGYGDWPITMQKEVLGLAQGEKIGVRLTESFMLVPRKSITAVIGFGRGQRPQAEAWHKDDDKSVGRCTACTKVDCLARRMV